MIVINSSTRQFNIPGADLVFGVTADAGAVVKEFQCPRYVGNNLDLAGSFIRMNYRNANGEIDSYLVKDVTVDDDNVTFGWELSPKVTMYKGNLNFVMCVVGPDTKVKWHTTLGRGQVLEGLEPDSAVIEEGTADIVAQLVSMVEAQVTVVENVGAEWARNVQSKGSEQITAVQSAARTAQATALAQIEAKGVNTLASIPEDYTSLENTVDNLVRDRAGAIVCEVAGTVVAVTDASDHHMVGARIFGRSTQDGVPSPSAPVEIKSIENPVVSVYGKNLLPYPYHEQSVSQNGMTLVPQEDGGISVSGTPTGYVDLYLYDGPPLVKSGKITISIHGMFDNVTLSLGLNDANGEAIGSVNAIPAGKNYITLNLDDYPTAAHWLVLVKRINNNQAVSGVIYPQVELGETSSEYEPYKPVQTIETTHTLPGVPVESGGNYTDENGQQWLCDEVSLDRGVLIKRLVSHVMTGDMLMYVWTDTERERGITVRGLSMDYSTRRDPMALCSHYRTRANGSVDPGQIGIRLLGDYTSLYFLHEEGVATTMDEWRAFFEAQAEAGTPVTILVKAEQEIEIPLSETEIAAFRALRSNYPNTTVTNNGGAHMAVAYVADTKRYIDNKIAALLGG